MNEAISAAKRDATRLKEFIRRIAPGGCRMFSQGDACECLLCAVDRLYANAEKLRAERIAILTLIEYAKETEALWDADHDMKVGKRLLAMAGDLPGYSAELDNIHER